MQITSSKRINFISHINSILLALMLTCNSIAMILPNIDNIVVIYIILLFTSTFIINIKGYLYKQYFKSYLIILFIITIFIINIMLLNERIAVEYFFNFIIFGVPFLLVPFDINYNSTIKAIFIIGLVLTPIYLTYDYGYGIFNEGSEFDSGVLMTTSYRILPFIFASILFFRNKKSNIIWKLLSLIIAFIYLGLLLIIGSRGAVLAVLIFALMIFINSAKNNKSRIKRLIITTIISIASIFSFKIIIEKIYLYTVKHDIQILFINRFINYFVTDTSVDSGRSELYSIAINEFKNSPLIGNGIGSYNNFSGDYPHNLFLQILSEGGLFLFIPFLFIFLYGVVYLYKSNSNSQYFNMLSLVFCSGVIQLQFSYYFWGSQFFWFFIFLVINRKRIMRIIT